MLRGLAVCALLLISACSACGAEPEYDPELKVLLDHFLKFAPNSGKLELVQSIKFKSVIDSGERGHCGIVKSMVGKWKYEETREITIDPIGERSPVALTVYHELGHCLFDFPHSTGPHDIMNPMRVGDPKYWTPEQIDTGLQAMFLGLRV
jgi:hypothetical protein